MDTLEDLLQQGFSLRSFPSYPRHLGVEKYNCVALLELTPEGGWKQFGTAGYLLEGQIGLLIERRGKPVFVHKSRQLLADGEPLENFQQFVQELQSVLRQQEA